MSNDILKLNRVWLRVNSITGFGVKIVEKPVSKHTIYFRSDMLRLTTENNATRSLPFGR